MSHSHKRTGFHKDLVYSSDEVMQACGVTANTLSNWKAQGLLHIEGTRPNLFRGQELIRFHAERTSRGLARRLRHGEFRCFPCRAAVMPELLPNSWTDFRVI